MYTPHILWVVRHHMQSRDRLRTLLDADDFVQSVCAAFLLHDVHEKRFDAVGQLRRYLSLMAVHKIIDARRAMDCPKRGEGRVSSLDSVPTEQLAAQEPSAERLIMGRDEFEHLLRSQPGAHQLALRLMRDGWTDEDIACNMRLSTKTLQRLRGVLRQGPVKV
jgi:DNA-directed RNA polymerase specialized sigma24 family protein